MLQLLRRNLTEVPTLIRSSANLRFLSQTNRTLEKSTSSTPSQTPTPVGSATTSQSSSASATHIQGNIKLSAIDKWMLVWTGKYKSINEVPDAVERHTLLRSRDKFRVKSSIYMMIAIVIACIIQIVRGKEASKRGESVVKMNEEFHRKYNVDNKTTTN